MGRAIKPDASTWLQLDFTAAVRLALGEDVPDAGTAGA